MLGSMLDAQYGRTDADNGILGAIDCLPIKDRLAIKVESLMDSKKNRKMIKSLTKDGLAGFDTLSDSLQIRMEKTFNNKSHIDNAMIAFIDIAFDLKKKHQDVILKGFDKKKSNSENIAIIYGNIQKYSKLNERLVSKFNELYKIIDGNDRCNVRFDSIIKEYETELKELKEKKKEKNEKKKEKKKKKNGKKKKKKNGVSNAEFNNYIGTAEPELEKAVIKEIREHMFPVIDQLLHAFQDVALIKAAKDGSTVSVDDVNGVFIELHSFIKNFAVNDEELINLVSVGDGVGAAAYLKKAIAAKIAEIDSRPRG